MGLGFKISELNGTFHLSGVMDEHSDYYPIVSSGRPAKLNVRDVQQVNSLGVALFIRFLRDLGASPWELHEASSALLEMINSIPATLGTPPKPDRVKSIMVPYWCLTCRKESEKLLPQTAFASCTEHFPKAKCDTCGEIVEASADPDDLLVFLTCLD